MSDELVSEQDFRLRFGWVVRQKMRELATAPGFVELLKSRFEELYQTVCNTVFAQLATLRKDKDPNFVCNSESIASLAAAVVASLKELQPDEPDAPPVAPGK